jgi:hypothetical protein
MPNLDSPAAPNRLQPALIAGGLTALFTAAAGLLLFLAACQVIGVDVWQPYPALLAGLLARGPLGYAAWMTLLMAVGAPFVGAGVFAMLYARR